MWGHKSSVVTTPRTYFIVDIVIICPPRGWTLRVGSRCQQCTPHTLKCQGFFLRVGLFLGKAAQALISGGLEACAPLGGHEVT